MESPEFIGPQDLIKKICELTNEIGFVAALSRDPQLEFLHQMFLTALVASKDKGDITKISKKILQFIEEKEVELGKISTIEFLKNKEICLN